MSQSNEILAMLSAGVSLGRILVPIFGIGLVVTGLSMFLSYAAAPQAEARRELAQAEIEAGSKIEKLTNFYGYLFPNRRDSRLWYIERMPADFSKPLENVQVVQQDPQGNIVTKYYGKTAVFNPAQHTWDFEGGRLVHYSPNGDVKDAAYPPSQIITGWSETPWRIASQQLQPDKLSVPELHQYLALNSDFTPIQLAPFRTYLDFRWALPWTDMVVVLFTAPLGIVYQRRSVLTGVASSILFFLVILFTSNLFLALGRGARTGPFPAAWTTNIFFACVGLVLLRQRSLNRDPHPVESVPARPHAGGEVIGRIGRYRAAGTGPFAAGPIIATSPAAPLRSASRSTPLLYPEAGEAFARRDVSEEGLAQVARRSFRAAAVFFLALEVRPAAARRARSVAQGRRRIAPARLPGRTSARARPDDLHPGADARTQKGAAPDRRARRRRDRSTGAGLRAWRHPANRS